MASREARPPPKTTLKMFSCIGHWGLFHVNPKCLLLLDKTSVCIFSPGKSLPRSHIHLASVFFNPCSSSQLSRSTTFNSCLHIPCVVRTKMPGQPTGSPVTVPYVLLVFGPSTFHIFRRTNIISKNVAREENVIDYIWCGAI